MPSSIKKIIILIACIFTLIAFAALVYFVFVHKSVADYLKIARTAIHKGDIQKAEDNYLKVIQRDKTNEAAYKALAEIAEKNNKPALAAVYWGIAAKLNPLSDQLNEKYLSALLEAHQYPIIMDRLHREKVDGLTDFELYALTKASYYQKPLRKTWELLEKLLKRAPVKPRTIILQANITLAAGKNQKASELFRSLIKNDDKKIRVSALTGLGRSLLSMKEFDEAGDCYRKAVKLDPESVDVRMLLGSYNLSRGKFKTAESQYIKMHKDFPDNLFVVITLAEIYVKDKNIVETKRLLNHIKTKSQLAVAAKYYLRALLSYLENKPVELKKNLDLCKVFSFRPLYAYLRLPEILITNDIPRIKRYVTDLRQIDDSKAARADLCRQIERLALNNFKKNKFDKAEALGLLLEELQPKNPGYAHLVMACAFNRQRWYKAINAADKFNKLRPGTLDYLRIKGRSLLFTNKPAEALSLLYKLAKIDSKNPEVWLWAIQASQLSQNKNLLADCTERLLEMPFSDKFYMNTREAASFLLAENNQEAAAMIADKMLIAKSKKLLALGWSVKAQLAQKKQKWQQAIEYMLKACELDKNSDRLLYVSDLYFQMTDYEKAMSYVNKVLQITPEDPKALYRKALIFQMLADYDKALKVYEELLQKYPKWSLVLVNMSDIMALKGNAEEALKLARRAKEESPLWPRGKFCLAMREMENNNFSVALRIFQLLQSQEPDNEVIKESIEKCLIGMTKQNIREKDFVMARLRIKQLKRSKTELKTITALEASLKTAVKADKAVAEKSPNSK